MQQLDLEDALSKQLLEDRAGLRAQLVEQLIRLREPARDQLGRRRGTAVRAGKRGDDDHHAVLGQSTPVTQRDVRDVADRETVYEHDAAVHAIRQAHPACRKLDDRAVLGKHDRARGHAGVSRHLRLGGEHPILAVHGHHGFGPHEADHRADLLRVAVSGDVHGRDLVVQYLRAGTRELVDRVVHSQLVPGDGLRGDDHRVAALDLDGGMVAVRDPGQRGHRLTLAARAEDEHPLGRVVVEFVRLHERIVGYLHVAERARY